MTINAEALYETLDHVIAVAPEGLHHQESWLVETRCGTAACFCGWRFLLDGGTLVEDQFFTGGILPGGVKLDYSDFAEWGAERFGLSREQAGRLFWYGNTLEDLKHIVDELCGN